MEAPTKLRDQLQTLSIPKHQRPVSSGTPARRSGAGPIVWILLLAVLGLGGYVGWNRYGGMASAALRPEASDIRLMKVVSRPTSDAMPVHTATGKVVSDHRVEVVTKVSGQIVALFFEQGDRVKTSQLLARVEDVNYRARRDEAAARVEKSKANLEYQEFNFQRISRLHAENRASDVEFADSRHWYDDAKAQLAADHASLDFARKALADTEVSAPIDGVVLERNVEVGDFVAAEGGRGANANAQFAAIADMSKLRVEVDVSELDIARLRKDMPCVVAPDAYKDRKYHGHVMWIDPGANYAKATVQVKVRIDDPDDYLRVEGSAQVSFLSDLAVKDESAKASYWIPVTACAVDATGGGRVFVAMEGRLKETRVTTGRRVGNQIEVLDGLTDGQMIAADQVDKLTDSQRIKS